MLTDDEKKKRKSERDILKLLKSLDIECYGKPKQVQLKKIFPGADPRQHLEIDIIGIKEKTGFLIEVTELKDDPIPKIKKFIYNFDAFLKSNVSWDEKIKFFKDIPSERADDFEDVTEWKKIYFGTSYKLIQNKIDSSSFPSIKNLYIFNGDEIEYLKSLIKNLGKYAKYQFLASIGIKSNLQVRSTITRNEFIKIPNRLVTGVNSEKADVYLMEFSPKELLEVGRVYRYGDLLMTIEDKSAKNDSYQRIIIKDKIKKIAKNFLSNNKKVIFPNTITLVLSNGCRDDQSTVQIPNHYASIDIIDGQHRVYAYAHESISEKVREDSRILATAIKFKTNDTKIINKSAAKLFWEINSSQSTVKHELLYLIKYGGLGDKDPIAIAGEIIRRINDGKSALGNMVKTQPIRQKNKFNETPIPIVTIVEELADLLDFEKYKATNNEKTFKNIFGNTIKKYEENSELLIKDVKIKIEYFFNQINKMFSKDWKSGSNSDLLSSNYLAAFTRLFKYLKIEKNYTNDEIEKKLEDMKNNLTASDEVIFKNGSSKIIEKRAGVSKIYDFLKKSCNE